MPTALSPFRYVQLARYVLQRWLDLSSSPSAWKGKARALPNTRPPIAVRRALLVGAGAEQGVLRSSVVEETAARPQQPQPKSSSSALGPDPGTSPTGPKPPHGGRPHVWDPPSSGPSSAPANEPSYPLGPDPSLPPEPREIYRLMNDQKLFIKGAIKPPREVVVLCHGLYGFSTATPIPLFPSLKLHYWASVLEVLRDRMGVKVLVVGVKGTGSIKERAEQMHDFLQQTLPRGTGVNFVAHSMGGLDCRHLISTIRPTSYTPLSLTTIGTPHRGSPFMDWCAANIGVGTATAVATAALSAERTAAAAAALPYSLKSPLLSRPPDLRDKDGGGFSGFAAALTSYLLNIFDSPAYSNLTTSFLRDHFNPSTPDLSSVKYLSVAGRTSKMSVLHPLWFPKLVLDAAAENGYGEDEGKTGKEYEGNDGLVSVSSAKWGEFLGAVDYCHHWDLRGEGGLFPQGGKILSRAEEEEAKRKAEQAASHGQKAGQDMAGGWDLQDGLVGGLGEYLGLSPGTTKKDAAKAIMAKADAQEAARKGKSTNGNHTSASGGSGSSWDIAQVGQVLDWVTDLLPGGKGGGETGKKQLEDTQREKEREASGNGNANGNGNGNGNGKGNGGGSKEKEKEKERKAKQQKFDLARFYGGLMLKLREDGF